MTGATVGLPNRDPCTAGQVAVAPIVSTGRVGALGTSLRRAHRLSLSSSRLSARPQCHGLMRLCGPIFDSATLRSPAGRFQAITSQPSRADHLDRQQLAGRLPLAGQFEPLAEEFRLEDLGKPLFSSLRMICRGASSLRAGHVIGREHLDVALPDGFEALGRLLDLVGRRHVHGRVAPRRPCST